MGFKLPGKSITSGTSGHRSALKMTAEANAAQTGSSPGKAIGGIIRGGGAIVKYVPKAAKLAKKALKYTPFTDVTKTKSLWSKIPGWAKGAGAYLGIDAAMDAISGSGDDKKTTTTTTPKTTTPKTSSGDSWSKAVKRNKSTGGGVTLSEYVKRRNAATKGSAEYAAAQNKINEAYGSSTRHSGGSSSSPSSSASTSTTKTRKRLGGGTTKITKSDGKRVKVKYDKKGKVKKTITKGGGRRTVRDSEGNITRSRKTRNEKWD